MPPRFLACHLWKSSVAILWIVGSLLFASCYEPPVEEEGAGGGQGGNGNGASYDSLVVFARIPEIGEGYGGFVVLDKEELTATRCRLMVMTVGAWRGVSTASTDSLLSHCRVARLSSWRLPSKEEVKQLKSNVLYCGLSTINASIRAAGGDPIEETDYYYCLDEEGNFKRFTFASGNVLSVSAGKQYDLRGFSDLYIGISTDGLEWGSYDDEDDDLPGSGFGGPNIDAEGDWSTSF